MKVSDLLALAGDDVDVDAQVFIERDGFLFEVRSAEIDADGDLVLTPYENVVN